MINEFLEEYAVRCIREIINLFNNDKFEIGKENLGMIEKFFVEIKTNKELYTKILDIYSKELKVFDYYLIHQEKCFDEIEKKYSTDKLVLMKEFSIETSLPNQESKMNDVEVELLRKIFSKKMNIIFNGSDLKLSMYKSSDFENKIILTVEKEKEKTYIKS